MAGKEGESYLDELLDNASALQHKEKNKTKKADYNEVGLDEALAVLNDLPDETGIPSKGNSKEDLEELKTLFEEFGDEEIPEEEPETNFITEAEPEPEKMPEAAPAAELEAASVPMPELEVEPEEVPVSIPELEIEPEAASAAEPEEEPAVEPEEALTSEPETASEEDGFNLDDIAALTGGIGDDSDEQDGADFEDMEAMLDLLQQPDDKEESKPGAATAQTQETKISSDPVAVDDIFQDALSAVQYSADEEELEKQIQEAEQPQEEVDSTVEDIFALDDVMPETKEDSMSMDQDTQSAEKVPIRKTPKKKKPALWKRLFGNVVTDETAALEEKEREREEAREQKKQEALIAKQKKNEESKEEKAKKAEERKERQKQLKEEKATRKEEKKLEKKRLKEERAAMEEKEVVGKINPIGATIVFVFFATIGVLILVGVWLFPRRANIKEAENQYASEQYIEAYKTISTISVKKDEQALYDKIELCSKLQRQIQSYQVNVSMNQKVEALHSLLQGLDFYNKKQEDVKKLKVQKEFLQMKTQIVSYLAQDFQVNEAKAGELLAITDETEYTSRLQQIAAAAKK